MVDANASAATRYSPPERERMTTAATVPDADERAALVRRGIWLTYATIGYNALEAVASLVAGLAAGSAALVSFGADSLIEVSAAGAARWRLRGDADAALRERAERTSSRIIGWTFVALGVFVTFDSGSGLWHREQPRRSVVGMVILALSVLVMPLLARAKRRVANGLDSSALLADATQTSLCAYLSAIGLAGVGLNALLGWWWADPVAALVMVPIMFREGIEGVRGESSCDCAG
jgi:divalent metal cation (Fe/Co/Zn/Cd) transporter